MNRFCLVMIVMVGVLWSLPLHAGEEAEKPQKPTAIFTQSDDGDVLFEAMGDARYIVSGFTLSEEFNRDTGKSTGRWSVNFTVYRPKPHHHTQQAVTDVKTLTLKNVDCVIDRRDTKTFRATFFKGPPFFTSVTFKFVLVEGADAEVGKDFSVRGTFLWKKDDSNAIAFREEKSGRLWKTTSLKHDP